MNTPSVEFLNVPVCSAFAAANGVVCCATGMPQRVGVCSQRVVLAAGT